MNAVGATGGGTGSLPLWERGLKSGTDIENIPCRHVAPLVGAWIEINASRLSISVLPVAPLVGAWIEIAKIKTLEKLCMSLPLWERGLK